MMIPYARQDIQPEDVEAVKEILVSDWLTQGPAIERFEIDLAKYCGAQYAVVVCNATAALHLSCLAAGLKPGDYLWTSPNTFVASANCGIYCRGKIDFVDIDPKTYNISIAALEQKLVEANKSGNLPKVVIPVHFGGQSCEMASLKELSVKYGFAVIEDASHALGGSYRGMRIGNCRFSDMAVFSFHPVKIITTGEGGAVLTNDENLYKKLKLLRSHGITRDPALMKDSYEGGWFYQQIALGFNYRMTDIQAALGSSQLAKIDSFVDRRNKIAKRYDSSLKDLPLTIPWIHPDCKSAYHLYVIRINRQQTAKTRKELFDFLRSEGINANVHYIPVHTQPFYREMGFKHGDFPEAEKYYAEALSLPMFPKMKDLEQEKVIAKLKAFFKN